MKRSTLLLLIGVVFLSFGYTTDEGEGISKIYLIDNLLLRTQPGIGIDFYDIANPASVSKVGAIALEGNGDVAAKGRILYADRGNDLLVYNFEDPSSPQLVDSVMQAFRRVNAPNIFGDRVFFDEDESFGGMSGCGSAGCAEDAPVAARAGNDAGFAESGTGGSLARFMIVDDLLYCLDDAEILIYDISQPARPRYVNAVGVDWGIETIFHDGDHLFIGGESGMYILSLDNPRSPTYISDFQHRRACDPVVVEGDRAYVTLRGGSRCGSNGDQLDIIDISDITNPTLLKTVEMSGPYGLGVRDGIVLVCDGAAGLKAMDVRNLEAIEQCGIVENVTAYDVIWYGDLLILTAEDGFRLYDASDPCNLTSFGFLEF